MSHPAAAAGSTSPRTGPPPRRLGSNSASSQREYPHTIVSTGNCAADRACPNPTATSVGGNHRSHCAISPATYWVRLAGSGGKNTGRSSRICGSTASTIDPVRCRWYLGWRIRGQRTLHRVLRTPTTLAITLIGIPSARCNRRISAQSSTDNTPSPPPGSTRARIRAKGVNIRASTRGQFSRVGDSNDPRRTAAETGRRSGALSPCQVRAGERHCVGGGSRFCAVGMPPRQQLGAGGTARQNRVCMQCLPSSPTTLPGPHSRAGVRRSGSGGSGVAACVANAGRRVRAGTMVIHPPPAIPPHWLRNVLLVDSPGADTGQRPPRRLPAPTVRTRQLRRVAWPATSAAFIGHNRHDEVPMTGRSQEHALALAIPTTGQSQQGVPVGGPRLRWRPPGRRGRGS